MVETAPTAEEMVTRRLPCIDFAKAILMFQNAPPSCLLESHAGSPSIPQDGIVSSPVARAEVRVGRAGAAGALSRT
jgi:hypothetical protein